MIAGLLATVLATGSGTTAPATAPAPFETVAALDGAMTAVAAGADPEPFWRRVLSAHAMPLIFGDTAVFLYRGPGETVEWRGDFNGWESSPDARGKRLGASDVWTMRRKFLPAARIDYKIVVDGDTWLVDPLNPFQQTGGYGPNSEVHMPGWTAPSHVGRGAGVPRGTFTEDLFLASRRLGYEVRYRVWTPAGLPNGARDLPALYVTDGSDYWRDEMGALVGTLDTLAAENGIVPIVVVFVDPWDRAREKNLREEQYLPTADRESPFGRFLVEELIPAIDARYPTRREASGRVLLGTSYGGLVAAFIGLNAPGAFGGLAIQSPALAPAAWIPDSIAAAPQVPAKVFLSAGLYETGSLDAARKLRRAFEKRGVRVSYVETPEGHSWGQWRALLDDVLVFFFAKR